MKPKLGLPQNVRLSEWLGISAWPSWTTSEPNIRLHGETEVLPNSFIQKECTDLVDAGLFVGESLFFAFGYDFSFEIHLLPARVDSLRRIDIHVMPNIIRGDYCARWVQLFIIVVVVVSACTLSILCGNTFKSVSGSDWKKGKVLEVDGCHLVPLMFGRSFFRSRCVAVARV